MLGTLLKAGALFIVANLLLTLMPIHDFDPTSIWTLLLPLAVAGGFFIHQLLTRACPHCDSNFALQRQTTRREIVVERPALLKYRCRFCSETSYREASYGGNPGGGAGGGGC